MNLVSLITLITIDISNCSHINWRKLNNATYDFAYTTNQLLLSAISSLQSKTSNGLTSDMGTGGGLRLFITNVYGDMCYSDYYTGPTGFHLGETSTLSVTANSNCNNFILPNKVNIDS